MADVALAEIEETVAPVRALYDQHVSADPTQTRSFEIEVDGVLLSGSIADISEETVLLVSWSKREIKYLMEAYLYLLAGTAAGIASNVRLLSANKGRVCDAMPVTKTEALARLSRLIAIYKEGHQQLLPFCVEIANGLAEVPIDELGYPGFVKHIEDTLDNFNYPCTDEYIMREYNSGAFDSEDALDAYKKIHRQVVSPLTDIYPSYFA
jgi:exodeoxyribonuclease V gamma subunit